MRITKVYMAIHIHVHRDNYYNVVLNLKSVSRRYKKPKKTEIIPKGQFQWPLSRWQPRSGLEHLERFFVVASLASTKVLKESKSSLAFEEKHVLPQLKLKNVIIIVWYNNDTHIVLVMEIIRVIDIWDKYMLAFEEEHVLQLFN